MSLSNLRETIQIKSYDELLGGDSTSGHADRKLEIEITLLRPFPNHPFKVRDDEDMAALCQSILENGIIEPLLVRRAGEIYQVISGHRRLHAAEQCGLTEVPVRIIECDEYEAVLMMVDSNLRREHISVYEKAKAYRMRHDALKYRRNVEGKTSRQIMSEELKESERTVARYITLSKLIDQFLNAIDNGEITVVVGEIIAVLSEDEQSILANRLVTLRTSYRLSKEEALRIREVKESKGSIDGKDVLEIIGDMKEERPVDRKARTIQIPEEQAKKFFSTKAKTREMQALILELLEKWYADGGRL